MSAGYFVDIVRRNSVLVTHGSQRVYPLLLSRIPSDLVLYFHDLRVSLHFILKKFNTYKDK